MASGETGSSEQKANAFDNNVGTYWQTASGSAGAWLGYDFGAGNEQTIVEISLQALSGFASRMPREFDVQYSDDASTWSTAWSCSFTSWTNAAQVFSKPSAVDARYWRLRPDTIQSGGQVMGCAEMEMRATAGGVDQTGSGTAIARTSFSGSFLPANAFDNNVSTEWSGANAVSGVVQSDWLGYDFGAGATKSIQQIVYTARASGAVNQAPLSGWIESSPDGVNWLSRWTFAGLSWSPGSTNTF
jgi:hypothetical protein